MELSIIFLVYEYHYYTLKLSKLVFETIENVYTVRRATCAMLAVVWQQRRVLPGFRVHVRREVGHVGVRVGHVGVWAALTHTPPR